MSHKNHKLRLGIVGAGEIVRRRHLPALERHPDVEIVAVSNSTYESSEEFCRENAPHATPMPNWAELLAIPEIERDLDRHPALHAFGGDHFRARSGQTCFLSGAHGNGSGGSGRDARGLAALSRAGHDALPAAPWDARGLLVQKLLAEKALGQPHHLRLQSLNSAFLDPDAPAHWRQRIEISGLNVLTLGIYVEVLQQLVRRYHRRLCPRKDHSADAPGIRSDHAGFAHGSLHGFANGMEGVLEFSGIDAHAPADRLEVYGDLGTIDLRFRSGHGSREPDWRSRPARRSS